MDYGKEYKSLVAKIKKAHQFAQTDSTKSVLEDILPQLRESEDERIRKALINHFKSHSSLVGENWNGIECDDIIAYLEKQKEQKPQGVYVDCTEHPEWYGMPPKEQKPEWSEKDKDILESLIRLYSMNYSGERWDWTIRDKYTYGDVVNFLKSLRPHPEKESVEEKTMNFFDAIGDCGFTQADILNLKSIWKECGLPSPQPHWKPSWEQMGALSWMLENARANIDFDPLKDLYEQLKKL